MTAAAVLALDAGQTGIKARVTASAGPPRELDFPGILTDRPLLPQLAAVARRVSHELETSLDVVSAGVSGLTRGAADAHAFRSSIAELGVHRALLAHDAVTSFLGALGSRSGAVIAAGTGAVTFAVGPADVARVDGWGNIMGDAGSGYWIGRLALEAAMRAHDGRGRPTALRDLVIDRWPDIEGAYIQLQNDPDRVRLVASFAAQTAALCGTDEVATAICMGAADELARSVTAALRRVHVGGVGAAEEPGADVALLGGVFRSRQIRERFAEQLMKQIPHVNIVPALGSGLDGVSQLLSLSSDSPLHAEVSDTRAAD